MHKIRRSVLKISWRHRIYQRQTGICILTVEYEIHFESANSAAVILPETQDNVVSISPFVLLFSFASWNPAEKLQSSSTSSRPSNSRERRLIMVPFSTFHIHSTFSITVPGSKNQRTELTYPSTRNGIISSAIIVASSSLCFRKLQVYLPFQSCPIA